VYFVHWGGENNAQIPVTLWLKIECTKDLQFKFPELLGQISAPEV
jgi:hypothetical protein